MDLQWLLLTKLKHLDVYQTKHRGHEGTSLACMCLGFNVDRCCRTLQPEYKFAQYLSEVECLAYRRLLSRFSSGCYGLRVDTGRWEDSVHPDRKDGL